MNDFKKKYLKYKNKYLNIKHLGGGITENFYITHFIIFIKELFGIEDEEIEKKLKKFVTNDKLFNDTISKNQETELPQEVIALINSYKNISITHIINIFYLLENEQKELFELIRGKKFFLNRMKKITEMFKFIGDQLYIIDHYKQYYKYEYEYYSIDHTDYSDSDYDDEVDINWPYDPSFKTLPTFFTQPALYNELPVYDDNYINLIKYLYDMLITDIITNNLDNQYYTVIDNERYNYTEIEPSEILKSLVDNLVESLEYIVGRKIGEADINEQISYVKRGILRYIDEQFINKQSRSHASGADPYIEISHYINMRTIDLFISRGR